MPSTSWGALGTTATQTCATRLAHLLTGDRAVAEDLLQEAFVRFVGRLHYLRDPGAFDGYLRRTVVRFHSSTPNVL